jgi:hypothetical protein
MTLVVAMMTHPKSLPIQSLRRNASMPTPVMDRGISLSSSNDKLVFQYDRGPTRDHDHLSMFAVLGRVYLNARFAWR